MLDMVQIQMDDFFLVKQEVTTIHVLMELWGPYKWPKINGELEL